MSRTKQSKRLKTLSIFGLFVIISFPIAMLFVGFSNLEIRCQRSHADLLPDCVVRETRFLGLYERKALAARVTDIGYRTRDTDASARASLASSVVLRGANGSIPVSEASSNVGYAWKADLITKTRHFLDNSSEL